MTKLEELTKSYAKAWKDDIQEHLGMTVISWDEMGVNQRAAMVRCTRVVIEALMTPSEAMIAAASGALKAHIDALPPDVRAKSKDKGGVIFVGPTEKHAIRFRAMLRAVLDEKPESK